jgi:hypothetical protein
VADGRGPRGRGRREAPPARTQAAGLRVWCGVLIQYGLTRQRCGWCAVFEVPGMVAVVGVEGGGEAAGEAGDE